MEKSIPIICPYCGVGCNLELTLDETGVPKKCSAGGRNPELNAVVFEMYDTARKRAGDSSAEGQDGPFWGVPFLLKDILGDHAGVPTTSAVRALKGLPMPTDSELVIRYRKAGLIPLAKTNVPEIGTMPTTEPQVYGPALESVDAGPRNLQGTVMSHQEFGRGF